MGRFMQRSGQLFEPGSAIRVVGEGNHDVRQLICSDQGAIGVVGFPGARFPENFKVWVSFQAFNEFMGNAWPGKHILNSIPSTGYGI